MENNENTPLIFARCKTENNEDQPKEYKKYWYRWYLLLLFSLLSLMQSTVWNTWGPISISAKYGLGLTDNDIDLLANWVAIASLPFFFVFVIALEKKGLRLAVLVGSFCVALGTGLRCLPVNSHAFIYVPPLMSNLWFPSSERVTSTSLLYLLGNFGNAFGFLVGPIMVQLPNGNSTLNSTNKQAIRTDINHYMYLHFGLALPIFIAMLIFFPNKPPTPPSSTASIPRLEIKDAIKKLIKVPSYWVIVVTNGLFLGSYYGWSGVFADLYSKFNISQTESSWVGFTMTVAGIFVGSIVGLITDRVKKRMKLVVLIHIVGIFIIVLYLVIASMQWIDWPPFHFTSITMWVCCILIGIGASSFQPIIAELGAEHAFPVSEGTSSSIMMWFFMLCMFLFLTILHAVTDKRVGNYLFLAFTFASIPFFFFFVPNHHARLDIDNQIKDDQIQNSSENTCK